MKEHSSCRLQATQNERLTLSSARLRRNSYIAAPRFFAVLKYMTDFVETQHAASLRGSFVPQSDDRTHLGCMARWNEGCEEGHCREYQNDSCERNWISRADSIEQAA